MVEAKLLRKKLKNGLIVDKWDLVTIIEKQQAEIDRLNYDLDGFKQNFFVSGFHLQIKMANEQLLKQQEQIDALKSELDRAVELYTDKAIKVEQLEKELTEAGGMIGVLREQLQEEIQARADVLDDLNNRMMKFMKSYNEMAWKLEEVGGAYTHPVKELTDEEIVNLYKETEADNGGIREFARAILRKAQEK